MAARKGSGFPFPAQLRYPTRIAILSDQRESKDPSYRPRSAPVPTTRYTDKELRKIAKRIKKRHEKLRRRYKEVHGRRVDWIDHFVEEGWLYVEVRFKDGSSFNLQFSQQILTEGIELIDRRTGDDKPLKEYYRRRVE